MPPAPVFPAILDDAPRHGPRPIAAAPPRARDAPPCRAPVGSKTREGAGCMPMHDAYRDAAESLIGRAFARHAPFCKCDLQKCYGEDDRRSEMRMRRKPLWDGRLREMSDVLIAGARETLIGRAFSRHERNSASDCAGKPYAARLCGARSFPVAIGVTRSAFGPSVRFGARSV